MIERLVRLAEAYCAATGESRASVSKSIFARGGHFDALEKGERDIATGTFERALAWFSAGWPADAPWPQGIERPVTFSQDADRVSTAGRSADLAGAPAFSSNDAGDAPVEAGPGGDTSSHPLPGPADRAERAA